MSPGGAGAGVCPAEERLQWEHIQELKERVVERPLLVEEYHRPEHTRSDRGGPPHRRIAWQVVCDRRR